MAQIIGDKVIWENVECWRCNGKKEVIQNVLCPEWNHKVRGRLGGTCPHCGAKNRHSHQTVGQETVVCPTCEGAGIIMEDLYFYMRRGFFSSLEFKVFRDVDRSPSYNEQYLGHKIVAGVTDYGRCHKMTDEQLVDKVRNDAGYNQYTKVVDKDDFICRFVGIFVHNQGYTIRAIWDDEEECEEERKKRGRYAESKNVNVIDERLLAFKKERLEACQSLERDLLQY